jgi:hypothetical protein
MNLDEMIRFPDLIPERNRDVDGTHAFRQKNLKGFSLGFQRLQRGVPDILGLHLRTIEHLVASAVCCLWMIMLFRIVDFLPVNCFCGHFQDHSVMGRSAVRNAMAGIMVNPGVHYNHRLVVF